MPATMDIVNFDLVTRSFALMAGEGSSPFAADSPSRCKSVVVALKLDELPVGRLLGLSDHLDRALEV